MKRLPKIILNVCIAFLLALALTFFIAEIQKLCHLYEDMSYYTELLNKKIDNPESVGNSLEELQEWVALRKSYQFNQYAYVILGLCAVASCVYLFIYCNPRLFRRSTWENLSEEWAKTKSERAAAKRDKSVADKEKRLQELQAEIDELKKE